MPPPRLLLLYSFGEMTTTYISFQLPRLISQTKMINFRDLEVVGADFGTFTISGWFWGLETPFDPSCHSGACQQSLGASWAAFSCEPSRHGSSATRESHVARSLCFRLGVLHHALVYDRFASVMIQAPSRSAAYPGRRTTPHYRYTLFRMCHPRVCNPEHGRS